MRRLLSSIVLLLFFASGVAALIYQLLWMKELGRLFGVTAYAAATTLAAFFLGIAAGSYFWGRRAADSKNLLSTYARIELGIAVCAVLYFVLFDLYTGLFPILARVTGTAPFFLVSTKFVLAILALSPAAFFMGGTLPIMGQFWVRQRSQLGERVTLLYLVNTLGACGGVLLAGFILPPVYGFRVTYIVALGITLSVAALAYVIGKIASDHEVSRHSSLTQTTLANGAAEVSHFRTLAFLAVLSGVLTLALEVLWTRMFEQVLQNSVYTFAAVLLVFLISLALGSTLANRLCKLKANPQFVLVVLLILSACAVSLTPRVFLFVTDGLTAIGRQRPWADYLFTVLGSTAAVIFIPALVIGTVFPYLMKAAEANRMAAGETIGRLASVNNLAAIAGSVIAGFLLLRWFGLWKSIQLVSLLYLFGAMFIGWRFASRRLVLAAVAILCAVIPLAEFVFPVSAVVAVDEKAGEKLVGVWEGSHGTVAVVDRNGDLRLRENNLHVAGTSNAAINVRLQTWIPLCIHPHAKSVFYLGMGTGITAGGALDYPVEQVLVTELNPQIVKAVRACFTPFLNGLLEDPRVTIVIDDGRNRLLVDQARYDVIIADIFLTHHAGIANLYTREHFSTVKERLNSGGLFCQWLPMFELSPQEFRIVARTMMDEFPQVTLWRRGFSPTFPVFALVGSNETRVHDASSWTSNVKRLESEAELPERIWFQDIPYASYVADLSAMRDEWADVPRNTDDHPVIEYLAPIVERNRTSTSPVEVLAWRELADFTDSLVAASFLRGESYMKELPASLSNQIAASNAFYRSEVERRMGNAQAAQMYFHEYEKLIAPTDSTNKEALKGISDGRAVKQQ